MKEILRKVMSTAATITLTVVSIVAFLLIIIKISRNNSIDEVCKLCDESIGITSSDYQVIRRYGVFGFNDAVYEQSVKIKKSQWHKVEKFIAILPSDLPEQSPKTIEGYKPKVEWDPLGTKRSRARIQVFPSSFSARDYVDINYYRGQGEDNRLIAKVGQYYIIQSLDISLPIIIIDIKKHVIIRRIIHI